MTLEQGEAAVTRAWVLSAAGIALFLLSGLVPDILRELFARNPPKGEWAGILLSVLSLRYNSLYLFQPWMFPGVIGLPALIIIPLLTYCVYRRSRVASVRLLSIYVLVRVFMSIWLYVHPGFFVAIWMAVSLAWGFVFFQGARGTFLHHKGRT